MATYKIVLVADLTDKEADRLKYHPTNNLVLVDDNRITQVELEELEYLD
jgi:hypothetical protein